MKFTVKGTYLTGNLTLKLTNETGFFSIDKTTITKSAATNGATVTVTYKPTSAGTHKATITISGGGLTSNKTISLMGNAKKSSGGGNNATTTSLLDETTVSSGDWAWSDMMNNQTTIVKDQDVLNNDQKDLQDKQNNSLPLMSPSNTMTDVNELVTNSKVYTDGQIIVIESPVDQSAIISDISGHSQRVNLQSGHNEIPVNSSGIYIVRIRDKATKLILR